MKKITVTSPLLPPLTDFTTLLEDIWERKWLTNNGTYHNLLEEKLEQYLGVEKICLFSNGTLALSAAIQALEIQGEVITTPYSFVATSHAIALNNLTPVFVDIEPHTFNLDPAKIEDAITDKTSAIIPVHVYGNPCDHEEIKRIADKHNLKIIYDAAHAFGVKKNDNSILNWGDLSVLSFHATKAYSTIEGGAVVCHSQEMKNKLDKLKSFGFVSETEISLLGTNAKMNEVQAAFGLLSLNLIDEAIKKRKEISELYRELLNEIEGIKFLEETSSIKQNYSYFPILVDEASFGMTRDMLYHKLHDKSILARRYFYPLITDFELYREKINIVKHEIDIANEISNKIICLPIHHELTEGEVKFIVNLIKGTEE